MRHVAAAIAEMFNTGHVRQLREAARLERLLLGAVFLESSSRWAPVFAALGSAFASLRVSSNHATNSTVH